MPKRKRKHNKGDKSALEQSDSATSRTAKVPLHEKWGKEAIAIAIAVGCIVLPLILMWLNRPSLTGYFWKKTPCKILVNRIAPYDLRPELRIAYTYEFNGTTHTNSTYSLQGENFKSFADAYQAGMAYPADKQAYCRVNPSNSTQSILRLPSLLNPAIIFFAGFTFVGCVAVWTILKPDHNLPRWCELALGVTFFSIPVFFLLAFSFPVFNSLRARSWESVPCTAIGNYIEKSTGRHARSIAYVTYTYDWQGQKWFSNQYKFDVFTRGYISDFPGTCYINPSKPYESVVKRNLDASSLVVLFPLFICGFIAKSVFKSTWPTRRRKRS